MNKYLLDKIDVFTEEIQRLRRRRKIVSFLSLLVVFVTVNALMLPAITMEKKAICGYEEHQHNEDCYSDVSAPEYLCLQNFHHHGEECYKDGELVCNILLAHIHNELCCDSIGNLICPLEEIIPHTHSDECKTTELMLTCNLEEDYHKHSDDCYIVHDGEIICGIEETEGHTHSERCYTVLSTELICGIEETEGHAHGDECYQFTGREMICAKEETQGHTHADGCYADTQVLKCTVAETRGHTHSESCFIQEKILLCTSEENENHTHDENCFTVQQTMVCGLQEQPAHSHIAECYETQSQLICTQAETEPHIHDDSCYEDKYELICTQQEVRPHIHTERCYKDNLQLVCELEEKEPHTHGTECYEKIKKIGCEKEEKPDGHLHTDECYEEKTTIVCTEKEVILHTHTETCYDSHGDLVCEQTEIAEHIHTEECTVYKQLPDPVLICEMEEHLHTDECYPPETDDGRQLVCIREQHIHTDACGENCEIQEHLHTDDCYKLEETPQSTPTSGPEVDVFDISNGPVVIVQFGESVSDEFESEEDTVTIADASPVMMMFSTRTTSKTTVDLEDYVIDNGGKFNIILLSQNDTELPKVDGNYVVNPDESYKLFLTVDMPTGMEPGYYTYQLPEGVSVTDGGRGYLQVDGITLGTWEVNESGTVVLDFHEISNSHTHVIITATMGISFAESKDPIEFDGNISVKVEKPGEVKEPTEIVKFGLKGDGTKERPDTDKIYWTVEIKGKKHSDIPGDFLIDSITSPTHSYTESDKRNGIKIGVSHPDPVTGEQIDYHTWKVHSGDEGLIWDESGWQYIIPEYCKGCNTPLGNENWIYYIEYTSTPNVSNVNGILGYHNKVNVDDVEAKGEVYVNHYTNTADIVKKATFNGGAEEGTFRWEVYATIPGVKEDEDAVLEYFIQDELFVKQGWNERVDWPTNSLDKATVSVIYKEQEITISEITKASADDMFCYQLVDRYGTNNIQVVHLYHKCQCTADKCVYWNAEANRCGGTTWENTNYCRCWTLEDDVVFKFSYATTRETQKHIFENHSGQSRYLVNNATLAHRTKLPNGGEGLEEIKKATAEQLIPGDFKKELTQDYNNGKASYRITVNEAKVQLTDGSPLIVHDAMTETLAYINGSLVITREDTKGAVTTLTEGVDYRAVYDGSGNHKYNGESVHLLEIEILRPEAVKYIIEYDTMLIFPDDMSAGVKYKNSAYIQLWGDTITDDLEEKTFADINMKAQTYEVYIVKRSAATQDVLEGVLFGLYNKNGALIDTEVSDADGKVTFKTDVTKGVVLQDHEMYYIQEIATLDGYVIDDTKHWFHFCKYDAATECTYTPDVNVASYKRIPKGQLFYGDIYNSTYGYELPETGGTGTQYYTAGGLGLIIRAAALLLYRSKKCRKEDITSP